MKIKTTVFTVLVTISMILPVQLARADAWDDCIQKCYDRKDRCAKECFEGSLVCLLLCFWSGPGYPVCAAVCVSGDVICNTACLDSFSDCLEDCGNPPAA
jgi:hypothetical protein